MKTVNDLWRRLSRAIEADRGISLSPSDLYMLVSSGAIEALQAAATEELKERYRNHKVAATPTRTRSTDLLSAKSPENEEAEAARRRARSMTRP